MSRKGIKIYDALNSLKKEDIYSLMLFTLYKLKDDPQYLTLTELCYLLDGDSLMKFLRYYGGMTITIPETKDLRLLLQGLRLFQYVQVNGGDFAQGLSALVGGEFTAAEIKEVYAKLCEVTSEYDFNRD